MSGDVPPQPRRPGRAHWAAFTIAAVAALVADQLTKALVRDRIASGERIDVAPAVELVHTTNRGVAFGLFEGRQGIVAILTAVALVAIAGVLVALGSRTPGVMAGAGLLVGGSIGNLVDRLSRDGVTDFLAVSAWPAFNVADIAIVIGAGILAAGIIADRERHDG